MRPQPAHRPLLTALLALACALPPPPLRAQVHLPALGESASDSLSVADERRLGEQIMRDVWRDPLYLDDPMLLAYVQSLWAPLVASARRLGHIGSDIDAAFAWETFLVRDRSVNAFALPGGHVGVHLGLLAMTTTRDEFASVLAHELSHVSQRHIARGIGSSQRATLVGMAAMILAMLAAARSGNSEMAQAAVVGGQAAMVQGQLNFSRDVEREADRIGFGVLSDAAYSPAGMAAMFERLASANRIGDSSSFPYLRSHPLTTDRISEARSRLLDLPAAATMTDGDLLHTVMRARARVLMDPQVESLRRLLTPAAAGSSMPEQMAATYSAALAASLLGEHADARRNAAQVLAQALALPPADSQRAAALHVMRQLNAEVLLAADDAPGAARQLAADDIKGSRPAMLLRAQVALAATRQAPADGPATLRDSIDALQIWTAEHPTDATAWRALAQCADAAGLPLRAARAAAEARAATGDLSGAIDLLRGAQRRAGGTSPAERIEAQIIDARLRAVLGRLRQEQRERGLISDRVGGGE